MDKDIYSPDTVAENAVLRHGRLRNSDLRFAEIEGCDLRGADIAGCDLTKATLTDLDLRKARIDRCNMARAEFWNVDLTECKFDNCQMPPDTDLLDDMRELIEAVDDVVTAVDVARLRHGRAMDELQRVCAQLKNARGL